MSDRQKYDAQAFERGVNEALEQFTGQSYRGPRAAYAPKGLRVSSFKFKEPVSGCTCPGCLPVPCPTTPDQAREEQLAIAAGKVVRSDVVDALRGLGLERLLTRPMSDGQHHFAAPSLLEDLRRHRFAEPRPWWAT